MGMFDRDEMEEEWFPWFSHSHEAIGEWDVEALKSEIDKIKFEGLEDNE